MALRIKSHWWDDEQDRSLTEIAGALAFIAWRLSVEKAIHLHCERFIYDDDKQRLAVVQEYLIFLIQVTDRLSHEIMGEDDRRTLITGFAAKVIEHVQDNSQDLLGRADFGGAFVELLDRRSAEYAELRLDADGPSYPFLRYLGYQIQCIMGKREENRWVIDQIMEQDGWDAYKHFTRAFENLFDN